MKLKSDIIRMLTEKIGMDATTHNGASALCEDINRKTNQYLSINTLKRMVGILPYDSSPRLSTLNILAIYLGHSSWNDLIEVMNLGNSGFDEGCPFIDLTQLEPNTHLRLSWTPDRTITIRHLKNGTYEVIHAENSKLKDGDVIYPSQAAEGFPFFVKEVVRNGVTLGSYSAASRDGLKEVRILE